MVQPNNIAWQTTRNLPRLFTSYKLHKSIKFVPIGFVTQLSVTPTLTVTTLEAKSRFTPDKRACYFDDELSFDYLPSSLYR